MGIFEHSSIVQDLTTVTRYWSNRSEDVVKLAHFVKSAAAYSLRVLVVVNTVFDQTGVSRGALQEHLTESTLAKVCILPLEEWEGVTHALNSAVVYVCRHFTTCNYVLFQSVEVECETAQISVLRSEFATDDILVVGAALPGHACTESNVPSGFTGCSTALRHDTVPWNTLAMWNLRMLAGGGGFPSVADTVDPPGMEEVAAVAYQQKTYGHERRRATLIDLVDGAPLWRCDFSGDESRANRHAIKMENKKCRIDAILAATECYPHPSVTCITRPVGCGSCGPATGSAHRQP